MASSCSAAPPRLGPCFKSSSSSRTATRFLSTSDLSVSLEPSFTNGTQSLHAGEQVWLCSAGQSVSRAATPAIRAICAALRAPVFPLAPLKVADVTVGLDDTSRGCSCVKTRFRPKMANRSGWMTHPVDGRTEFSRIHQSKPGPTRCVTIEDEKRKGSKMVFQTLWAKSLAGSVSS